MVGGLVAVVLFNLPLMRFLVNWEEKSRLNRIAKELKTGPKAFRKVASELLKKSWPKFIRPILFALLVQTLLLLLLLSPIKITAHLEIAIGFWLIFFLCYLNADIRFWPPHMQKMRFEVAKKAIRMDMLPTSEAILLRAALRTDPSIRLAVATVLKDLTSEKSLRMVTKLCEDRDPRVAAAAKESQLILVQHLDNLGPGSVLSFQKLVAAHKASTADSKPMQTQQIEQELDAFMKENEALINAYPNQYCKQCHCRPEKQNYLRWMGISCPKCEKSATLLSDIETVIGQIGGTETVEIQGKKLYLPVWDEHKQASLPAEIDILEIVGGQSISYDMAIATIWDNLEAASEVEKPNLPVSLIDHPPLNPASLRLLRKLDIDFSVDLSNA